MTSSPKLLIVELTFRVQRRLDCTTELNMAMESEDEIEMMRIAKKLSVGEYRFSDKPSIGIDYSKVEIPLNFNVMLFEIKIMY